MTDQQFMEVPDEMDPFYWVIREAIQHQVTPEQLVEFIRKVPR